MRNTLRAITNDCEDAAVINSSINKSHTRKSDQPARRARATDPEHRSVSQTRAKEKAEKGDGERESLGNRYKHVSYSSK